MALGLTVVLVMVGYGLLLVDSVWGYLPLAISLITFIPHSKDYSRRKLWTGVAAGLVAGLILIIIEQYALAAYVVSFGLTPLAYRYMRRA